MKSWKTSYTALLIAETLAMLGFGLSMPVIPLFLEDDIGITDPVKLKMWVGLIQSSAAITLAIFAPIWGHLADVYSRRAMLLRAMFGGAIVISLMAFVNSPWQLLVLRGIQGCLTGTVAAATVLAAGISPAAQVAFTLGLLQTGISIGNSLGPLVGGVLSDFTGYRVAFFSTGLTLALAGFIVLKWVEENKKPSKTGEIKKHTLFPDIKPILASPLLVVLMVVTFCLQASANAASPMLPLFLKELARKVTEAPAYIASSTGIVLGVGAAFTALAAALVGKISGRSGYRLTLLVCLSGGALLTLPQTFVTNMYQLTVLRAFSSFFIGGCIPVVNAIIAVSSKKDQQGSIYGFNSAVSSAGAALGPMIGSATAMLGYRAVFVVSALILGIPAFTVRKRSLFEGEGSKTA
jgi:DHA1 family multidrug resistance protein-like MFS transporter